MRGILYVSTQIRVVDAHLFRDVSTLIIHPRNINSEFFFPHSLKEANTNLTLGMYTQGLWTIVSLLLVE